MITCKATYLVPTQSVPSCWRTVAGSPPSSLYLGSRPTTIISTLSALQSTCPPRSFLVFTKHSSNTIAFTVSTPRDTRPVLDFLSLFVSSLIYLFYLFFMFFHSFFPSVFSSLF